MRSGSRRPEHGELIAASEGHCPSHARAMLVRCGEQCCRMRGAMPLPLFLPLFLNLLTSRRERKTVPVRGEISTGRPYFLARTVAKRQSALDDLAPYVEAQRSTLPRPGRDSTSCEKADDREPNSPISRSNCSFRHEQVYDLPPHRRALVPACHSAWSTDGWLARF